MGAVERELYVSGRGDSREKPWRAPGSEGGSEWRVTGMQREVKGRLRCWREKPGTGWRSRQNRDFCFRRYKANLITEGIDTTQLNTGDLLAAGRGGIPRLRVWKKVFSRVYLP